MKLISKILKEAEIIPMSHEGGIGSTGEAHKAILNGKKYLLRVCRNKEFVKRYYLFYKKFHKYGFFPKLLEKKDNYMLFEFINGRTGKERESLKVIKDIGRICGIINNVKANYDLQKSGRVLKKINLIKKKKVISKSKIRELKQVYNKLNKKIKLNTALEAGDVTDDNFIINKKGKVYFVDIEAIKPNIKGYGIAKSFNYWFHTKKEQNAFVQGYNSINSIDFYTKEYHQFVTLIFLIQRINFKSDKGEKKSVEKAKYRLYNLLENLRDNIQIEIKSGKSLTHSEIKLMEKARIKEYGNNRINFKRETKNTFFFVKDNRKIVAFGMLKPIKIDYMGKDYNILGIGNILSIEKGKGYGKIVMQEILSYLKKKDKTGLGFCGRKNMPFYEKVGFKTKKRLGLRFALRDIKTGEIKGEDPDDIGDGLYYEGKDKLISKMLKTKSTGYYWVDNLKEPHW